MAFKLDDIIFDSIDMGYAEKTDGTPLYVLSQLSEATIEITADSVDALDKNGTLIKRTYRGKQGTFSATNAMLNISAIGAMSGSDKVEASEANPFFMPKIVTVKSGKTIQLNGYDTEATSKVKVRAYGNNGTMDATTVYTQSTEATPTTFSVSASGVLTPPTDNQGLYIVKYERKTETGVMIENRADKFPRTVKLTLKALAFDPCDPSTLRGCYIVLPSFQVSPELTITVSSEGTLDYSGDLQVSYCEESPTLYQIFMDDDAEIDD